MELQHAIERACDAALRLQHPDGRWQGRNLSGPTFTAATLAFEAALGTLRPEDAVAGERALRAHQLPDGGLAPWFGAEEGNVDAALYLLAGLRAVGVPDEDPAAQRAREALARLGGAKRTHPLTQTVAALAGVLAPAELPRAPLVQALLPGHDQLIGRLLGVNALMPAQMVPYLWRSLRVGGEPPHPLIEPMRALAARRLQAYLWPRQNPSGGFAGVPFFTLLALVCLKYCGVSQEDPRFQRALAYARRVMFHGPDGLEVDAFESTYWDTAHLLRVLALSPKAAHREGARRGALYLARAQSSEPSPKDWQTPPPGAPESGGWSWQPGNERNPDFDTTAEVLSALGAASRLPEPGVQPAIDRGVPWLLAMQNPDGGWAAFSWGKPKPPPGALYVQPDPSLGPLARLWAKIQLFLAENGDPSTADIVGRVLWGLGECGVDIQHPQIAATLPFLQEHQLDCGGWWGRWAINTLASTAYIVSGLARVGADLQAPWVQRGLAFLEAHQNPDGGWGEHTRSYEDLSQVGVGESTVSLTGLVAWALTVCRRPRCVPRALRFLLDRQGPDGLWTDTRSYSTMFPLRAYWLNDTYPTTFALEALFAAVEHSVEPVERAVEQPVEQPVEQGLEPALARG